MLGGINWVRSTLLTVCLFCGPLLMTFMFLNTVAWSYKSTAALPFGTICIMLVLWALVTLPLTVVGAIAGKNSKVSCPLHVCVWSSCAPLAFRLLMARGSEAGHAVPCVFCTRLAVTQSRADPRQHSSSLKPALLIFLHSSPAAHDACTSSHSSACLLQRPSHHQMTSAQTCHGRFQKWAFRANLHTCVQQQSWSHCCASLQALAHVPDAVTGGI